MSRKTVRFVKNAAFFPPSPQLQVELEISYLAKSEILYDENGHQEEINLLELEVFVNSQKVDFEWPPYTALDGRKFHAMMREAARDALYEQESKKALALLGAPQKPFVI